MEFGGLSSRGDKTDLADGDSPSLANCFFAGGRLNQIGPRPGRYVSTPTGYADALYGLDKLVLSNGTRRWMASHGTSSNQENAKYSDQAYPSLGFSAQQIALPTIDLSQAWSAPAGKQTVTIASPLAAGTYDVLIPTDYILSLTGITGGDEITSFQFTIQFLSAADVAVSSRMDIDRLDNLHDSLTYTRSGDGWQKIGSLALSAEAAKVEFQLITAGGAGVNGYTATVTGTLSYILVSLN